MVALFLVACSTFFTVFSQQLYGIFIDDPAVISQGRIFMLTFGFSIIGFGIFNCVQGAYMASGRTVPNMIMGMIRLWALRVPLAYIFGFLLAWGATGIWVGMGLSNFLSALIALIWVATGTWKRSVLEVTPPVVRETIA